MVAGALLVVILGTMVAEAALSTRHERKLRARGAVEPGGDVYRLMLVAYPACFVAMAAEGAVGGTAGTIGWTMGATLFLISKGLKYWAVAALGERWTFRVLVPADAPLVVEGPYRWVAHPNYVAVVGELVGTALMMAAAFAGVASVAGFGALIARRIVVEDRALGRRVGSRGL